MWQVSDLLDQEFSFINELLVIGSVFKKVRQERQKLVAVHYEDLLNSDGFVWVGDEHFEDVKALVLNHFAVIA